jgi:hypothetical protein
VDDIDRKVVVEKPGIHYQDQKYINENIQTITELEKQHFRINNIKQAISVNNERSKGNSGGN